MTVIDKIYAGQELSDGKSKTLYRVDVQCDTAADIPTPEAHWAAGSWLHVLENGGSLYTLGEDRTWYQQGIVQESAAVTTEETAQTMAAYSPPEEEAEVQEDESV